MPSYFLGQRLKYNSILHFKEWSIKGIEETNQDGYNNSRWTLSLCPIKKLNFDDVIEHNYYSKVSGRDNYWQLHVLLKMRLLHEVYFGRDERLVI